MRKTPTFSVPSLVEMRHHLTPDELSRLDAYGVSKLDSRAVAGTVLHYAQLPDKAFVTYFTSGAAGSEYLGTLEYPVK
jgi:hypothetical protein